MNRLSDRSFCPKTEKPFRLADYPAIAWSGCREVVPEAQMRQAFGRVNPQAKILVGCANGVDKVVRDHCPSDRTQIFWARDYGQPVVAALTRRSQAMVDAAIAQGGVLVAFPSKPFPMQVEPRSRWIGGHGGTWGTVLYALGNGLPVLLWSPHTPIEVPWGGRSLGFGWSIWI